MSRNIIASYVFVQIHFLTKSGNATQTDFGCLLDFKIKLNFSIIIVKNLPNLQCKTAKFKYTINYQTADNTDSELQEKDADVFKWMLVFGNKNDKPNASAR